MKLEIQYHGYRVPLTKAQWDRLDKKDFLDDVCPKMEAAGIVGRTIEYNGHFGCNIYFEAPVEVTEKELLKVLRKVCS